MTRDFTKRTLVALTALGFLACGETGFGPSDANTRVVLSGGDAASSSVTAARTAQPSYANQSDGAGATVSLSQVESITVDIDRIEVLKVDGEDGEGDEEWFELDVQKTDVDLIALTEDGITVATGDLPEGDYRNVRFFLSNETITFSEKVTLGNENTGMTFEGEHDLFIPSADETGLKVPTATFTVGEGDMEVEIVFDDGESIQTIVLTANGILMNPVLTATEPEQR